MPPTNPCVHPPGAAIRGAQRNIYWFICSRRPPSHVIASIHDDHITVLPQQKSSRVTLFAFPKKKIFPQGCQHTDRAVNSLD
jgi:hypothetical protein